MTTVTAAPNKPLWAAFASSSPLWVVLSVCGAVGSSGLGVSGGRAGSPLGRHNKETPSTAVPTPPCIPLRHAVDEGVPPLPGPHRVPAAEQGLTDTLQRGVGPVGLAGAIVEDTLDEAGGTGFALVARVAGVAQAGVEQRVVAHVNVRIGHILGAATSRWHWEDRKKRERVITTERFAPSGPGSLC